MVLAVVDLYQLRPVGKYVFELLGSIIRRLAGSVWQTLFRIFQLEEIMRQKDDKDFAALLNRVSKGKQTADDIKVLQDRSLRPTDERYNRQVLHIFATDNHNNERLQELGQPILV